MGRIVVIGGFVYEQLGCNTWFTRPAILFTLIWRLAQIKEKHEGAKSNVAHMK